MQGSSGGSKEHGPSYKKVHSAKTSRGEETLPLSSEQENALKDKDRSF